MLYSRRGINLNFEPKQVFYEPEALNYPLGKKLVDYFRQTKIPVKATSSHNRITGLSGDTAAETYFEAKKTLVIGVKRGKTFQTCKPSAHYQLPLTTSCPGMCEYCYLATTLGTRPYIRIYVNMNELLEKAQTLIQERLPEITYFEGAAVSDPIPVEQYTGSLRKSIEFFGRQPQGRFRFVTKFTDVDCLLNLEHHGHTRFRFSLNCEEIIRNYEHGTPSAENRIRAAGKVLRAGYPLGFIIAPIIRFENWMDQYEKLFADLAEQLKAASPANFSPAALTFEFITHRFSSRAKSNILNIYPQTSLPMDEASRKFKFGQFGYGKYVYPPVEMEEIKTFFLAFMNRYFPGAKAKYFI
ncbi:MULTISPECIES: spore photoproduct lyase [unclassified Dehalobacter]|uniref:spore photoproduct lyase n=1 Tax=unclassified Dehalobacter TaxID=2635733 RepID=UPI0018F7B80E|nr:MULTISPECIES: spore photoproduct lyase [unclassified Dehalobacter]